MEDCLLGAHTSASGGAYNALLEAASIGATTTQLFTANQKRWNSPPLTEKQIELFKQTLEETNLKKIMSHASYLINLGCPNPENLDKSRKAFAAELTRCHSLNISYLNFHPGAALDQPEARCLDTIVESLLTLKKIIKHGTTVLLLETTAGQGSCVGYCFEHLAYIIKQLQGEIPIGICIDTCHIFAAGYDLRTQESVHAMLESFDQIIGLQHLFAFHLNDSVKPLGSRVDRHAPLGKGEIGLTCFQELMNNPKTALLPKYLETPEGPSLWKEEIQLLKSFRGS